jgi:threonine-phosphate decarboxylase
VLAEEAALAAVGDSEHAARSLMFVEIERQWLLDQLRSIPGAKPWPTDANFVYVRLDYAAAALSEHLLRRRILIRNCAGWPGVTGEAVRVAVRRRGENERLLQAWREFACA